MHNVTPLNHKHWPSRFGWNRNVSRKNQALLDKMLRIEHLEQKQLLTGTLNGILAVNAPIDSNTPALVADDVGVDSPRLNLESSNIVLSQTQPGSAAIFNGGRLGNGSGEFRNEGAFAALTPDGSIASWGHWSNAGSGTPTGAGYTRIFSNEGAFAALSEDGSIASWGEHSYGGRGAPTGTGYTEIFSTGRAFAALSEDGAITAWGLSDRGGSGAPTDLGYTRIFSNERAFAALSEDGAISSWGDSDFGGEGSPLGSGFIQIASTQRAFAALNSDGTITSWGDANYGASETPTDAGYVKIFASQRAFAALKEDGSISSWGGEDMSAVPTDDGYVEIVANRHAFTAIKADGSLISWGNRYKGGSGTPEGTDFVEVVPTQLAFAARHADGSIATWGKADYGGAGAPTDSGYTQLVGSQRAFAAIAADGSITVWGHANYGGSGAPTGTGYSSITTNGQAFAALSDDGSISAWGDPDSGGTDAPEGSGFVTIAKPLAGASAPEDPPEDPPENFAPVIADQYFSIAENSIEGTLVGALNASDPDDDNLAYSIVQNIDLDGDGADAFRLEGNELLVNDADDLNLDSTSPLTIAVEASDGLLSTSASITVSITSTEGVIFRIAAGDSDALDQALFNAQGGDIIELAAGSTYLGDFKLSKKEGDEVIVIRTSAYASLPEGRVSPEDAPLMAKLADRLGQGDSALYTEEGASNYRIEGLEIVSLAETIGKLVNIGGGARTAEAFSNNITLDRCYVHGSPTQNIQRAILANGSNITVSNSYISEIHKQGVESQGFLAVLGTGPYTIENNFIEAAGENIMFGGGNWGNRYPDFQPEDITIKNNHISKPDRWNKNSPEYDGSEWSVKNLVEFKIGSNVLIEGNIIENVWQDAQDGPAVLIDPNESLMENIVVRNNVIRDARYAVRIATGDPGLSNVTIENNLMYNIEWRLFVIGSAEDQKIDNVTIRNNTALFNSDREVTTNDGYGNSQLTLSESTTSVENFIYQDNLIGGGRYAIKGTGTASGLASIESFMDNFDIRGNAVVDPFEPTAESVYRIGDNYEQNGDFYGDFSLQGTVEQVGFADTAFDDVEDFRIIDNAALQAAGTGVDIDALISALGS